MFTGLVEEVGHIHSLHRQRNAMQLTICCSRVLEDTKIGDSIAVNGVCLTVTQMGNDRFTVDVMPETMEKSNLGRLSSRSPVNLERAVAAGERFGGHFVQGHVDGTGVVRSCSPYENAVLFQVEVSASLSRWMIEKGSVTVNGISLTLMDVQTNGFTVSVIPHTLEQTQLKHTQPGDCVNIECDMIGKYVDRYMGVQSRELTLEKLSRFGFAAEKGDIR
ncbi:riboflavin synthase [Kroppenstedtia pulmonis]|uniref:Riboflavin synthase n=1 Tax=Kroppenstedtia pulmonis TaxID=1380685 RepID=A0A7D4CF89_9BACL|nr:riboflavin synthase [Kroppenstedtia pulmonis]QKG84274.1 riboflavin synthase [Kroppenstedtia pulmonis]